MTQRSVFRYFKASPEIRLAVMLYVRYPVSLRNVEDLLHERGLEIRNETVRFSWSRFGPIFASEIRRKLSGCAGRRPCQVAQPSGGVKPALAGELRLVRTCLTPPDPTLRCRRANPSDHGRSSPKPSPHPNGQPITFPAASRYAVSRLS
jgi:hypothetical protein